MLLGAFLTAVAGQVSSILSDVSTLLSGLL